MRSKTLIASSNLLQHGTIRGNSFESYLLLRRALIAFLIHISEHRYIAFKTL